MDVSGTTCRRASSSAHLVAAAAAVLMAMLLLLLAAAPAEASTFIAFGGPGCTGSEQRFSACGVCHNITRHGGYRFDYTGQRAAIFSSSQCLSEPGVLPSESTSNCFPFIGDAVVIRCE
ncbi:hypothetical protein Taro_007470 [Colocasia esculenta]|uniref:Antimicrobial peptide 1 n=1 Tax=Colocasia esculenta TaxID=4460 RepID=A0A843TRD2_COLES|nr:hypothetical protein [Colocasia esculenta]